jgi:GntR family transcriptional regulator/GntR family frlABCD operon transcriptional regulator
MAEKLYRQVYQVLKSRIQDGSHAVGSYLPSENELCKIHGITRTTARRALEELQKDGFIIREHGKGSRVKERRQTLGLLTVKGFSEAVGEGVRTRFLQRPTLRAWPESFAFSPEKQERSRYVIYFERLRGVGENPVMLECNWLPSRGFEELLHVDFEDGSFFKTLSKKYMVEITGSEQELRAQQADERIAHLLKITLGSPILNISIRFETSQSKLRIYSCLFCNTDKYPIGNIYHHRL